MSTRRSRHHRDGDVPRPRHLLLETWKESRVQGVKTATVRLLRALPEPPTAPRTSLCWRRFISQGPAPCPWPVERLAASMLWAALLLRRPADQHPAVPIAAHHAMRVALHAPVCRETGVSGFGPQYRSQKCADFGHQERSDRTGAPPASVIGQPWQERPELAAIRAHSCRWHSSPRPLGNSATEGSGDGRTSTRHWQPGGLTGLN